MSKNIFIFLLLNFFVAGNLFAQHRGDNWCFFDSCGINFNSGSPTNFLSSLAPTSGDVGDATEANATISDEQGNLLFYTNGQQIWNNSGDTLVTNLLAVGCGQGSSNGCLMIPFPGKEDSIVAYFYLWNSPSFYSSGLYYSLLNTNLNGGLGDIDLNTLFTPAFLIDSVSEQLTAIKHANGRDWWLIFKTTNTPNDYYKILLGPNGIEKIDSQNVGVKINGPFDFGEISSNPQGDLIGSVHFNKRQIELFKFDRCSGDMTLIYGNQLDNLIGTGPYGCSFSPDGRNFYYSVQDTLYQMHINNNFSVNNKTIVGSHPFTTLPMDSLYSFWQHELAPDGKIYIVGGKLFGSNLNFTYREKNLCVINNPNGIGTACDFQTWSYYLGGHKTTIGLPNMPNYNLGKLVGSPCDTLTSIENENLKTKNSVSIYPNPATEQLTIDNGQFTITEIEISDVMGRIIYEEESHTQLTIIHCQLFPPRVYFIKLQTQSGEMQVMKFVKE